MEVPDRWENPAAPLNSSARAYGSRGQLLFAVSSRSVQAVNSLYINSFKSLNLFRVEHNFLLSSVQRCAYLFQHVYCGLDAALQN